MTNDPGRGINTVGVKVHMNVAGECTFVFASIHVHSALIRLHACMHTGVCNPDLVSSVVTEHSIHTTIEDPYKHALHSLHETRRGSPDNFIMKMCLRNRYPLPRHIQFLCHPVRAQHCQGCIRDSICKQEAWQTKNKKKLKVSTTKK